MPPNACLYANEDGIENLQLVLMRAVEAPKKKTPEQGSLQAQIANVLWRRRDAFTWIPRSIVSH